MSSEQGHEAGGPKKSGLWPSVFLTALTATLVLAAMVVGLTWLYTDSWVWDYQTPDEATDPGFFLPGAVRSALLIVGGFGGIVALVVAYRRQKHLEVDEAGKREAARDAEAAEQAREAGAREQVRLFTERFGKAAELVGSDEPAVRLAGIYAMSSLADEWEDQRQQCVDVLCAYLRLPPREQEGEEQVRLTVVRVIRQHLRIEARPRWDALDFDFQGAVFLGNASFHEALFSRGARFDGAMFRGEAHFEKATFIGGAVFSRATFSRDAKFNNAELLGNASFDGATFAERAWFVDAVLSPMAFFGRATFLGDALFSGATFAGGAHLSLTTFTRVAKFDRARFLGDAVFHQATFSADAEFARAAFSRVADFGGATLVGRAGFSHVVLHEGARFGRVTFSQSTGFGGATLAVQVNLREAKIAEGCAPTFTLPDGTETTQLPVIPAHWPSQEADDEQPR